MLTSYKESTMDLLVTFTGLFMFVRDPGGKRVHALVPATPPGDDHHHDLTLEYRGLDRKVDLTHWRLDLSGAGGTGKAVDVPDEVLDAGTLAELRVDSKQWSDTPRDTVIARVTLPPFHKVVATKPVKWDVRVLPERSKSVLSDVERYLTHELTWRVPNVDQAFFDTWQLVPLPGNTSRPKDLPRPDLTVARIYIQHVPTKPPETHKGDEAPHFHLFYSVFNASPNKRPHPYLDEEPETVVGGSPFNCILAQSPPE